MSECDHINCVDPADALCTECGATVSDILVKADLLKDRYDALVEAARERVDANHNDGCFYRPHGECFCGHDALAAELEKNV